MVGAGSGGNDCVCALKSSDPEPRSSARVAAETAKKRFISVVLDRFERLFQWMESRFFITV
jgi:hypothetical protein